MSRFLITIVLLTSFMLSNTGIKAQVMDNPPQDGVYEKILTENRKPIPYAPLRESDAFWTKRIWRVIDMREKINHPFYYPIENLNGRRSLMQVLFDGIKEGTLTAFDPTSDEFLIPQTYDDVMKILNKTNSQQIEVPDPNNPGQTILIDTVIAVDFNIAQVKKIRIKEDWFFDKQRSVMDVRILGICPVLELIEDDGVTLKGNQPLFWIYFPEARELFAKAEVYNRFNDAERRTLDDIFFKRMFSSYIYKEENVYDRKIDQYSKGMDALLESERIKNEIFIFEHDLWEQ
ncbi:MAG TPA: gliding motility protein GldN [Bacteroidales bacterium]|nr:gliding motility protein GldN [Bacteroidales bacterium]HQI46950.1 gliding motility protein GldN [Bacteroidales bacterium]